MARKPISEPFVLTHVRPGDPKQQPHHAPARVIAVALAHHAEFREHPEARGGVIVQRLWDPRREREEPRGASAAAGVRTIGSNDDVIDEAANEPRDRALVRAHTYFPVVLRAHTVSLALLYWIVSFVWF